MTDSAEGPGAADPRDQGGGGRQPGCGGGESVTSRESATGRGLSADKPEPSAERELHGAGRESGEGGRGSAAERESTRDGSEPAAERELSGDRSERAAEVGAGDDSADDHGAYTHATPEELLVEVRTVRRQARRARHAYWFPLVLFGLLTCASVPFYVQHIPTGRGIYYSRNSGPAFLRSIYLGGFGVLTSGHVAYYWLAAILVGIAATAAWYRARGTQVGLRTPSRGFVITGLALLVLALLIPVLAGQGRAGPLRLLMPGDLLVRGTFPLVLIAIGLCVLAWAERSIALTVIAAGFLALSLVASLYDIENVFYRLGWYISPDNSRLPNVVLPALVLLLSGAGAWVVQRRHWPRSTGSAGTGAVGAESS